MSLAEFQSWLRTRNIDFILQIVSIMNDLPGDRPDCEVCPDPCLVTCDNGHVIMLSPPWVHNGTSQGSLNIDSWRDSFRDK